MHQIVTIAAGVALGILVAAGVIFIGYHKRQALSKGLIAVRQWAWRSSPWFVGAAVLALTVFLIIDAQEERKRKYLEQLRVKDQQESWRNAEETRKRVRAECDGAKKWVEDQCQAFRAAVERAQGDWVLGAQVELSACETREKMKLPHRPDCGWLPR